eukprot:7786255-Pyramimonas_sp.AAC.1
MPGRLANATVDRHSQSALRLPPTQPHPHSYSLLLPTALAHHHGRRLTAPLLRTLDHQYES